MIGRFTARFALFLSLALMTAMPAQAQFWQCVTFARSVTNIEIRGNAHTWWAQAAGRYERGVVPEVGAVMSFMSSGRMRLGHVAKVSKVVSPREVLLTHANWSYRGGVERNVRAVDVSAAGDWSKVQVWYRGQMGLTSYPVYGFIYDRAIGVVPGIQRVVNETVSVAVSATRQGLTEIAGLVDGMRTQSN